MCPDLFYSILFYSVLYFIVYWLLILFCAIQVILLFFMLLKDNKISPPPILSNGLAEKGLPHCFPLFYFMLFYFFYVRVCWLFMLFCAMQLILILYC